MCGASVERWKPIRLTVCKVITSCRVENKESRARKQVYSETYAVVKLRMQMTNTALHQDRCSGASGHVAHKRSFESDLSAGSDKKTFRGLERKSPMEETKGCTCSIAYEYRARWANLDPCSCDAPGREIRTKGPVNILQNEASELLLFCAQGPARCTAEFSWPMEAL